MSYKGMFSFLQDVGNYEDRKVGRTEVAGLTVSTCFTSDEGYETAICDKNGAYAVERYKSKKAAKEGHEKWCELAKTITDVIELGWLDICGKSKIVLERDL